MPSAQGHITIRRRAKDGTPGTDAVRYWLVPSATQIKKSPKGEYNPKTISCKKMKSSGNASPIETTEGVLQYQITYEDGSSASIQNYSSVVTVPKNCQSIRFILKINNIEVASETVSVLGDGKGIVDVKEYYSKGASNTKAPSSWSETVPVLDSVNKYLWNYEKIFYSDGTSVSTTPAVIGVFGKGISSVTNFYLATDASDGVTLMTPGWTDAVQIPTATKRYLWNYEVILYTDGTSDITEPHIIGVYGEKGDPGNDAERYWLVPSATSIVKKKNGTFAPTTVSCKVNYQSGSGAVIELTTMFVRYKFLYSSSLLMNWQKYDSGLTLSGQVQSVEFELYFSGSTNGTVATGIGTCIDRLSIPVISDGQDGIGIQGLQGCIYRRSKWAAGFEFHNDADLDTDGLRYIDLVYITTVANSTLQRHAKWFRCRKTHTSSTSNEPKATNNGTESWLNQWEPLNSMDPIYTPLLFADNAIITLMQSNQLLIENDEGVITAGLSGSNSGKKIRIWAGSTTPDNAPFRVDVDGSFYSSKATISGSITATSGRIAGFLISGTGLTNMDDDGKFTNDAYIIFRNDTHKCFAGIGGNVLPSTSAMRAVARFENEDYNDWWGLGRNIAMLLSAKNGNHNHAFLGSGNGNLDGWIGGYKYSKFQISSASTIYDGYLKISENNKWIVYAIGKSSGVALPTLNAVQTALGIGGSTPFCVEFTIIADLLSQNSFEVFGRCQKKVTVNGKEETPYYTGEYPTLTHWDNGRWDSVEMSAGDAIVFLLIYDPNKTGSLNTSYSLKYTARIINRQN